MVSGGGGSSGGGNSRNYSRQPSAYEKAKSSGQSSYNWFNSKLKEAGNILNSWTRGIKQAIDKFRKIIEKKEQLGKPCDILHIVKLDDSRESVFLIQDMFPITEEYIEREYTIAGNHLMLTSEHTTKVIEQKARKMLGMLKCGVKFIPTQLDVLSTLEKLKREK